MDTKHPLTDDICDKLSIMLSEKPNYDSESLTFIEGVKYDMRCAADWQLEQVIEWIEKKRGGSIDLHDSETNNLIIDLKQAMRPQEDN